MTLDSTVFQKIIFQNISHFKAIGSQFDRQPSSKVISLDVEENVLPYMDMVDILVI